MKNSMQGMLSLLGLTMLALGCSKAPQENLSATSTSANFGVQAKRDMNAFAMNKVVCDPMNDNGTQIIDWQQGLQATLHYRGVSHPRWYKTDDYISKGQQSEQSLFFSDLFVPTRIFTNGFATQTSQTVKNDLGENLIEYFALKFKTKVRLGPRTPKGDYEIAALADDGVVVTQTTDLAAPKTILSGDSDHPTQLVCGASAISLDSDQGQNLEIKYYQGPRQHISLTLLWRPAQGQAEPLCGRSGNSFFFNPDNKSEPTANYQLSTLAQLEQHFQFHNFR
jgi:hypothetical protein